MNTKKIILYAALLAAQAITADCNPPVNLFRPYDVLLLQPLVKLPELQVNVTYEGLFDTCGMQADDDERDQRWRKCCNVLQVYQDRQDGIAAFKGTDVTSLSGQDTFLFSIDDDNGTHSFLIPRGDLTANNIMINACYAWANGITFGLYLPIIEARLRHVSWKQCNIETSFESEVVPSLIPLLESAGHLNLYGWKRHGLGDLAAMFTWSRFYYQNKKWLKNVHGRLRGALIFPTGLKTNENDLIAFAFGNDGGLGVLGGATLELWMGRYVRMGVDGEWTQVFGSCRGRRIKTDLAQTDLLFLTKVPAYKEIGFLQHYTLYINCAYFYRGLSARAAYQYFKHNDDKLYLATDHYSPVIANRSESLQEWTLHSFVLSMSYDFYMGRPNPAYYPGITVFYKHGFNGKRAILGQSVGLQLTMNF